MKAAEKNEAGWAGWLAGYATQKAEVLGPGCPRYLAWPHQSVSPASQWEVGGQLTALLQPTDQHNHWRLYKIQPSCDLSVWSEDMNNWLALHCPALLKAFCLLWFLYFNHNCLMDGRVVGTKKLTK